MLKQDDFIAQKQVLIAAHEQFMMANETDLIKEIYPKLLLSFGFYKKYYDSVSYETHIV